MLVHYAWLTSIIRVQAISSVTVHRFVLSIRCMVTSFRINSSDQKLATDHVYENLASGGLGVVVRTKQAVSGRIGIVHFCKLTSKLSQRDTCFLWLFSSALQ
jgi:hypothetical protein